MITITTERSWRDQLVQVIDTSKRVQVYRNLHKDCWSVRQSGKVVAHMEYIWLRDARMNVGQLGRLKVLETNRKNVHAYISGYVEPVLSAWEVENDLESQGNDWEEITYNPYNTSKFVCKKNGDVIMSSPMVDMSCHDDMPVLAMVPKGVE
tara:strand:- start:3357 stop:3809 length:453 start_codon:yes stop_codon:yes gene_type:complete